jgi:hypothetical protein
MHVLKASCSMFAGVILGFCIVFPASAARYEAQPLTGAGDYEFYFFGPGKSVEMTGYIRRLKDLEKDRVSLDSKLASELAASEALKKSNPKEKSAKLEWSPVENAVAYSVKVYDAERKLIDTRRTESNTVTLELAEGSYFFQVATVAQYKTGTYSHMAAFTVTAGKPGAEELRLLQNIEVIREKISLNAKLKEDYLAALKREALLTASSATHILDAAAPESATGYVVWDRSKKSELVFSQVITIEGKENSNQSRAHATAPQENDPHAWYWGAGILAGIQDTKLDYFRISFGIEAFVRYDRPYFKFFYPQLKLVTAYSGARSDVFDAMIYGNLYPGVYYPVKLGKGFTLLPSLSTGPNIFLLLSSAGSASVLQWGVMPAVELQYALSDRTALYLSGGINFTFDPNGVLKFIPISAGISRRF